MTLACDLWAHEHICTSFCRKTKSSKSKNEKGFPKAKKCFEIISFLYFVHIGIIFKLFYYLYYMAYMTKTDVFVYEYDPLTIRVCERGPHVRGVLCAQRIWYECKIKHLAYIHENHAR